MGDLEYALQVDDDNLSYASLEDEYIHLPFTKRLWMERQLFMKQRKPIFASLFVLVYGAMILFRNIAFYRYRAGPRLKDLGYDLFPEFSEDAKEITDVPMIALNVVTVVVLMGALLGPHVTGGSFNNRPHFVNIVRRMLCVYAIGHSLRAMTYLSTTIPGASDICLTPELLHPPKSIAECFYRIHSFNTGCGDLIFSGHMLFVSLVFLFTLRYGASSWGQPRFGKLHCSLLVTCVGLGCVQAVFILKARHHYSVDIVVALYTVPLVWYFYGREIQPHDDQVDILLLDQQMKVYKLKSTIAQIFDLACILSYLLVIVFSLLLVVHGNFKWMGL